MFKLIFVITCSFLANSAMAKSNIVGTWINNGKILSIQIVDDPAASPFVAGKIWAAMAGSGSSKTIKTQNFELKCSGATDISGKSFGNCKIKVARDILVINPRQSELVISQEEENIIIRNEFSRPPSGDNLYIGSGSSDQNGKEIFIFEVNWPHNFIGIVFSNSVISE